MPSELREALNAATASALVPKIIDPLLLEYQRRYSPVVRAVPSVRWDADQYYYNERTAVASGGFVTDGGARAVSNSTYAQASYQIKHLQIVGSVTGYAQQVTRQVIGDLRAREIQGSIRGLYWDVETALLWGNAAATAAGAFPQFDGLDSLITQANSSASFQNVLNKQSGGLLTQANPLSLSMLDELIDLAETNFAGSIFDNSWMLIMSNTAASKIAQLQTPQQRYIGEVTADVGMVVPTYRGIPIVKSSFLQARGYSVGTVTTATGTGSLPGSLSGITGSLASGTYKYVVTAVIARQGEIQPCAEVSITSGGLTGYGQLILPGTLTTGLDGSQPIGYKVYRSAAAGASGSETLLGYVDAVVGLSTDGVTPVYATSIYDTGAALIPVVGTSGAATTVPGTLSTAYFGTNAQYTPPTGWNGSGSAAANQPLESIYLISRDPDNVIRPYVREMEPLDVYPTTSAPDTLPYALTCDTVFAVRAPRYLAKVLNVSTSI